MNSSPAPRVSGRPLVWILYLGLIVGTLAVCWVSVRHPKTKAFHRGELLPLAKCLEIVDGQTLRVSYLGEERRLKLVGVLSPERAPERLAEGLDPEHEGGVARKVLQEMQHPSRRPPTHPPAATWPRA